MALERPPLRFGDRFVGEKRSINSVSRSRGNLTTMGQVATSYFVVEPKY